MKQLKQLVRNIVDPHRDLGHIDRHQKAKLDELLDKDVDGRSNVSEKDKGETTIEGFTRLEGKGGSVYEPTSAFRESQKESTVCEDCNRT